MSIHKANAALGRAEDALATPHKSLRELLICAWTQGLSRVEIEDLPAALRSGFTQLCADMTSKLPALPNDGRVQATLGEMDDAKLDNLARRIRGLAHGVELEIVREGSHSQDR